MQDETSENQRSVADPKPTAYSALLGRSAAPHWDHVPVDECELTLTFDGLFPERD